ncbi:MAG: cobalt ECF transporter T component CbiQ [Lachnospiraceae bacterium]|nr:cobalt ECF transporter T component CbiQ [Lachnospiraceae bacterium]
MHTHNHFPIDYYAYNSAIRNWNTSYKMLFASAVIITVISSDNFFIPLYTFLFMGFINTFLARLSIKEYLKTVKIPFLFILLGSIAAGACFSRTATGIINLDIGITYICFTKENITLMLNVILKAISAASAMYLVTLSVPAGEIITTLKKLHLPGIFIELMYLTYRYIFILSDEVHKMRSASVARLGYINFRTSCKSFSMMLGNLLIISLKNSRNYYNAMEARCYNGSLGFYDENKRISRLQALLSLIYFLVLIIFKLIYTI